MFADIEAVVVAYLGSTPGVVGAAVELPPTVINQLPFVLVTRSGGSDDYITDSASADVEVFHATRAQASASARTVHGRMMQLRHTAVNGGPNRPGGNPHRADVGQLRRRKPPALPHDVRDRLPDHRRSAHILTILAYRLASHR